MFQIDERESSVPLWEHKLVVEKLEVGDKYSIAYLVADLLRNKYLFNSRNPAITHQVVFFKVEVNIYCAFA